MSNSLFATKGFEMSTTGVLIDFIALFSGSRKGQIYFAEANR